MHVLSGDIDVAMLGNACGDCLQVLRLNPYAAGRTADDRSADDATASFAVVVRLRGHSRRQPADEELFASHHTPWPSAKKAYLFGTANGRL